MNFHVRRKLATVLHDVHCTYNHTDGCSWFYEEDWEQPWNEMNHKEYLSKADGIINEMRKTMSDAEIVAWIKTAYITYESMKPVRNRLHDLYNTVFYPETKFSGKEE